MDTSITYTSEQLERVDALSAQIAERTPETINLAQALFSVFMAGKTLGASIATAGGSQTH